MNRKLKAKNYDAVHRWIHRHYGSATKCESPTCDRVSKIYNWALKRDKQYEKDRNSFLQLCASCHVRYDTTQVSRKKRSRSLMGRPRPDLYKKIYQVDLEGNLVREYPGMVVAAKIIDINVGSLNSLLRQGNVYKGKWRFIKERNWKR